MALFFALPSFSPPPSDARFLLLALVFTADELATTVCRNDDDDACCGMTKSEEVMGGRSVRLYHPFPFGPRFFPAFRFLPRAGASAPSLGVMGMGPAGSDDGGTKSDCGCCGAGIEVDMAVGIVRCRGDEGRGGGWDAMTGGATPSSVGKSDMGARGWRGGTWRKGIMFRDATTVLGSQPGNGSADVDLDLVKEAFAWVWPVEVEAEGIEVRGWPLVVDAAI